MNAGPEITPWATLLWPDQLRRTEAPATLRAFVASRLILTATAVISPALMIR